MRKTYLLAALMLTAFQIRAATCPKFERSYEACYSRSMIESFQVNRVEVIDTKPNYEFLIKTRYELMHFKFATNGVPEEVRQPVPYVQTAHCLGDRIHLVIQNENEFGKESYEFLPKSEQLTIKTYLNSVLINEVICRTTD